MGDVIDLRSNRAIVKQNERGWIALVIENCRGVEYQFERQAWAEKFARDRYAEWKDANADKQERLGSREPAARGPGPQAF